MKLGEKDTGRERRKARRCRITEREEVDWKRWAREGIKFRGKVREINWLKEKERDCEKLVRKVKENKKYGRREDQDELGHTWTEGGTRNRGRKRRTSGDEFKNARGNTGWQGGSL